MINIIIITIIIWFIQLLYYNNIQIDNFLSTITILVAIFSTLYSNNKNDERLKKQLEHGERSLKKQLEHNERNLKEQLLFNKKQEVYLDLYDKLNKYWYYLDAERKQDLTVNQISYETFKEIYDIIYNLYYSLEIKYMSDHIQILISEFIKFVNNNIDFNNINENKDYNYEKSLEILSRLYPILKVEIGIQKDKYLIN